ncbi:hypothetical protein B0H17DRAFT_1215616 [Mycena rosella]|uniref:Uncharacterized protein n=1 Tax=Mycena rosella TaxID=1033263 RepID=A0AAD7CGV1_MYCRO|nr:hypothetical protein B0H17DRAFT_1215616 [Mycena rosella]
MLKLEQATVAQTPRSNAGRLRATTAETRVCSVFASFDLRHPIADAAVLRGALYSSLRPNLRDLSRATIVPPGGGGFWGAACGEQLLQLAPSHRARARVQRERRALRTPSSATVRIRVRVRTRSCPGTVAHPASISPARDRGGTRTSTVGRMCSHPALTSGLVCAGRRSSESARRDAAYSYPEHPPRTPPPLTCALLRPHLDLDSGAVYARPSDGDCVHSSAAPSGDARVYGKVNALFHLGGKYLKQVQKACYLGIWFETGTKFIWREQYKIKARKATTAANVILGLDRFVGTLPAWDMRTLYMARVDLYLTAGCEVCLDMDMKSLKRLEKVQHYFLRRMLGVGSRCLTAVLFSETGVWPIKYRRVYLALKNLCHLLSLKDWDRPAWNALQESISLARAGNISWVTDLRIVMSRLYAPVDLDIIDNLEVATVEAAMKAVEKSMEAWIDNELATSSRTKDLLTGRLQKDKDTGKFVKKSLDFRHYLRVKTADHRRALTRIVLSSHSLAVERRQWTERGKSIVPREWRLCRFCQESVEDPAHAMFMCNHPELMQVCEQFLKALYEEVPEFRGHFTNVMTFFQAVLARREVTPVLAKLAFNVLKIYDAAPMFLVEPPAEEP